MKKLGFLIALLLVFVLVGCQKQKRLNRTDVSKEQEHSENGGNSNMYKMKQAMKKGKQVKCIDRSVDNVENVIYIKGDKYRLESKFQVNDQKFNTNILSDGKTVYSWNDKAKHSGTKFDLDCMDEIKKSSDGNENDLAMEQLNFKDSDKIVEEFNEKSNKTECILDNSVVDFTPPNDVKFTDQCEHFKQIMKDVGQMKNSVK